MLNTSSLDTNILVRLATADNKKAYKKITDLLSDHTQKFIIEDAALIELVRVLEVIYHFERTDIVGNINFFCNIENISANKSVFAQVCPLYLEYPKLSFVDCYLAVLAEQRSAEPLLTLDKKLAEKLPSAKEL